MSLIKKEILAGTIRVNARDLRAYVKKTRGWKRIKKDFPELIKIVQLFKAKGRFKDLVDKINPNFLKGQLSADGEVQGARINILPSGEKLDKAYSLFASNLKIQDPDSDYHWDVLYQNKGGTWSYVYTLEKKRQHQDSKYKKVEEFEKRYNQLMNNVRRSLADERDLMAVPMYTLLNTKMRIGNETYFKAHGHMGLSTLTNKNVKIDGNQVTFDYIGKDGVPIKISKNFSQIYVKRLKPLLKNKFVFSKDNGLLDENDFKKAFARYCGKEFYPHIVRSHYATMRVKNFLTKEKVTKEEVSKLFMSIAHDLGHRKFNKKTKEWQEHYAVTVSSYIQPKLIERIQKKINS